MKVEPLVAVEPGLHVGVVVGGVVVQDQMHRKVLWHLVVDSAEEFQKFLVPMPGQALPDHPPVSTFSAANKVVVPLRL